MRHVEAICNSRKAFAICQLEGSMPEKLPSSTPSIALHKFPTFLVSYLILSNYKSHTAIFHSLLPFQSHSSFWAFPLLFTGLANLKLVAIFCCPKSCGASLCSLPDGRIHPDHESFCTDWCISRQRRSSGRWSARKKVSCKKASALINLHRLAADDSTCLWRRDWVRRNSTPAGTWEQTSNSCAYLDCRMPATIMARYQSVWTKRLWFIGLSKHRANLLQNFVPIVPPSFGYAF